VVNNLAIFDYTAVGSDLTYLRKVTYGQENCPPNKSCDLDMNGQVDKNDVQVLRWVLNNTLTVCDVGCGNGTKESSESCDDGNLTN
jgi:hypothetical protein